MFVGGELLLLLWLFKKYLSLDENVAKAWRLLLLLLLMYNSLSIFLELFEFDITELADDDEGKEDG